jgi:hypothetical protein
MHPLELPRPRAAGGSIAPRLNVVVVSGPVGRHADAAAPGVACKAKARYFAEGRRKHESPGPKSRAFSCGQRSRTLHQSVSQREAWARTLAGIRLGILIRETKAQDRNPGLSVCLLGGICVSLTVSNDDRKLGSGSRRTRCRICAASAFCVCSQLPLEPGCPPQ